jgi:hypothetical protein
MVSGRSAAVVSVAMRGAEHEPWLRPGELVEWAGPEPLEVATGTVTPGDVGMVLTDDRPAESGIVVVFAGVGTFACDSEEIRPHRGE